MQCKFLKLRFDHRFSAACVASLLIAANDFGYSTPLEEQSPVAHVLCLDTSESGFPQIQFSKGQVQHASRSGITNQLRTTPASGDTITTGSDGFVSVLLSNRRLANLQPNTVAVFDSSAECISINSGNDGVDYGSTPHLSAAIRG